MEYYLIETDRNFAIVEDYVFERIKRLNEPHDIYTLYTIKKLRDDDNWDRIINNIHATTNRRYICMESEEEIRDYGFVLNRQRQRGEYYDSFTI